MEDSCIPEIYKKRILILGCGNILFGDDGFGPAVCAYLKEHFEIPEDIGVEDCGTGVREILFNIVLSSPRPREIVIIDSIDANRRPGEIFEIDIEDLPEIKIDDFSMHQLPTSNLLRELRDACGVKVSILSCQVEHIPPEVKPGLSSQLQDAVSAAARIIAERYCCNSHCPHSSIPSPVRQEMRKKGMP